MDQAKMMAYARTALSGYHARSDSPADNRRALNG